MSPPDYLLNPEDKEPKPSRVQEEDHQEREREFENQTTKHQE